MAETAERLVRLLPQEQLQEDIYREHLHLKVISVGQPDFTLKLVCVGGMKEAEVFRAVNNLHDTLEEKGLITY